MVFICNTDRITNEARLSMLENFGQDDRMFRIYRRDANHGLTGWAPVTPVRWDWQKKSKNLTSLLAEFLFLPCPIRVANAPEHPIICFNQFHLTSSLPLACPLGQPSVALSRIHPDARLWINQMLWGKTIKLVSHKPVRGTGPKLRIQKFRTPRNPLCSRWPTD